VKTKHIVVKLMFIALL